MMDMTDLVQNASLAWLMGTGLVLGALHALEPGHAKTMIASFVVATRGTVPQAVLLGLSAAVSHSLLIWALAFLAITFGNAYIGSDLEPWLQLVSGVIIVGIGIAVAWRQSRTMVREHSHPAVGPQGGRIVDTGHGLIELAVIGEEHGSALHTFFYDDGMHAVPVPSGTAVSVRTIAPDGTVGEFELTPHGLSLASREVPPGGADGAVVLSLSHGGHAHEYDIPPVGFSPGNSGAHGHDHDHDHDHDDGHTHHHHPAAAAETGDAHARAHARQIEQRLSGRAVTTRQVALFGLTSGLMPCPAALTTLLVCLRLKKAALGIGLVVSFSLGLALTLVGLGVVAAVGVAHASRHLPGFGRIASVLPFASAAVIVGLGLFMAVSGASML